MFEISLLPHHQIPRTTFSADIVSGGWKIFPSERVFTFLFLDLLLTLRTGTSRNVKILKVIKLVETNQGNKRLSIFYCSTNFQQWNYSKMASVSYILHTTDWLTELTTVCGKNPIYSYNGDIIDRWSIDWSFLPYTIKDLTNFAQYFEKVIWNNFMNIYSWSRTKQSKMWG